ncbi:MAG: cofactor-independent phosphoglycerate mutase [Planctomycetia bacterium]|nr:cofactor-independent phosphoglycerate mutase [Planctomycetia bacterium]
MSRKYIIIIPDGFADDPLPQLGGKTPMQYAKTPHMDHLAERSFLGRSHNVPGEFVPGSDVATLSLLGYNPAEVYTGRAPLEACAQGIALGEDDWAFRCNLVSLQNDIMKSFTADHISTEEATDLLQRVQKAIAPSWNDLVKEAAAADPSFREEDYIGSIEFFPGVSYRNLMIFRPDRKGSPFSMETKTFPPHDYTDQKISGVLPQGKGSAVLRLLMDRIARLFESDPVNKSRIANGKLAATHAWLWGQGQRPRIVPFADRFGGIKGSMITAVDLLRGIAKCLDWSIIHVPNITGYVDTDFAAKGKYAADALDQFDLVCVHIEATDEAGHEGSVEKKIKALEDIDSKTLPPLLEKLNDFSDWRLLITPDHPTPAAIKTHSHGEVPWMLASSESRQLRKDQKYDEISASSSKNYFEQGWELMEHFLHSPLEFFDKDK